MEYANINNQFYCGIDLHARNLFALIRSLRSPNRLQSKQPE